MGRGLPAGLSGVKLESLGPGGHAAHRSPRHRALHIEVQGIAGQTPQGTRVREGWERAAGVGGWRRGDGQAALGGGQTVLARKR